MWRACTVERDTAAPTIGRYTRPASDRHAAKTAELDASLRGAGFLPVGPAVVAQYNPPSVPPPMRRNEVLLPIAR